jgi:hypothetical protein
MSNMARFLEDRSFERADGSSSKPLCELVHTRGSACVINSSLRRRLKGKDRDAQQGERSRTLP